MRERIEQWFKDHQEQLVKDVCELVRIRSVGGDREGDMPYGPGPVAALNKAIEIVGRMGFSMRNVNNYVGEVDMNDKPLELGIMCHLDVVPEGTGWSSEPYEPVVLEDRIIGRGSTDNKGPAIAALYAMACARELNPNLSKNCRLIYGTDEERGSSDLHYYFKEYGAPVPPKSFTPDAFFPVINTEKGNFGPIFGADWAEDKALPRILSIVGGSTGNAVPRTSEATVEGLSAQEIQPIAEETARATGVDFVLEESGGQVRIMATGKGAHAAMPHLGNNAQTALVSLLAALPLADSPSARCVRALNALFPHGDYAGKAIGVAMEDFSGPLTLNFGVLRMSETGFSGSFDSRVPACGNQQNVAEVVEERLAQHGIEIRAKKTMRPAHHVPEDSPFVQTLLRVYEQYTGDQGRCVAIGGGTYAHDIEGAVAFGCKLEGEDCHSHGADEFMLIERLLQGGAIFAQVILDICQ